MSTLEVLLPYRQRSEEIVNHIQTGLVICLRTLPAVSFRSRRNFSSQTTLATTTSIQNLTTATVSFRQLLDRFQEKPCLLQKETLATPISFDLSVTPPEMENISNEYPQLQAGGLYLGPKFCKPRQSVAIIIPYRDRETHLRLWLHYTLGTLIMQQLYFTVFVVEQEATGVFNKGQLMNTAFNWVTTYSGHKFDCFIFHDVDMIPEVPGNFYQCPKGKAIAHLSPFIDKFNYTYNVKIGITVGGVVAFREWQYRAVNGYSNVYWGWGGEDDDMNVRIKLSGLKRVRPTWWYGRYTMIRHPHDTGNPINTIRHKLLKAAPERMAVDGLSDLDTVVDRVTYLPTHTHIMVRLKPQKDVNNTTPLPENPVGVGLEAVPEKPFKKSVKLPPVQINKIKKNSGNAVRPPG
ncbi:unnamed protein product [Clavelina lepadiformis]|uniref:Beta-1,4-galactosyltransferase n=1 Tax=Clavelina lepadiformis TaxID=159417 RepID=A0ABP0EXC3_CLALP